LGWIYLGLKRSTCTQRKINHTLEPISVIIAAKNEAHNLPALLASISQLEDPGTDYEIIIVNDHSTDDTEAIAKNWDGLFGIRFIHFTGELAGLVGKKAALQMGIDAAKYEVWAFTDADCRLPQNWLVEIARGMNPEVDYLLGYSTIYFGEGDSDLRLVNFERSVYYMLAAAGLARQKAITASACNQIYRKSLFLESGGFEGIGEIPSGDDDLLLIKMMPKINKAIYNPAEDMQIHCYEDRDRKRIHHKNIRRASKYKYHPRYLKRLSMAVFSYFVLFYAALIVLMTTKLNLILVLSLIVKSIAELMLSQYHLKMVKKQHLGILYFPQILLFPLQFLYYGARGLFGKYQWKG